jgi:drug/metabolite transporter (DMT)-like permease
MATMGGQEKSLRGVAWMVISGLAFVGVNGVVKHLGTGLPAVQAAFLRFAFGVIFFLPALRPILRAHYSAAVWRLFGLRGLLHVVAVVFWFYAMARVPVAEMSAVAFLNPVIVLVLAGALLGEPLTLRRLSVVLAALAGALIVLRPGLREVTPGHWSQLVATLCFAFSYVCAKRLSQLAPPGHVVAILSVSVTLGLLPAALWVWQPVTPMQLLLLGVVGALATLGHYAMTQAFRLAPLAMTQPVTFLQILWSAALGALVFAEPVDPWVIAGGAVIIGAVSLNTWAETRAERARIRAATAAAVATAEPGVPPG